MHARTHGRGDERVGTWAGETGETGEAGEAGEAVTLTTSATTSARCFCTSMRAPSHGLADTIFEDCATCGVRNTSVI